jgi:hypothetical protein
MKWFGLAAILFAGFLPVSTQRRTARTERGIEPSHRVLQLQLPSLTVP